jgi:hypothetical protein
LGFGVSISPRLPTGGLATPGGSSARDEVALTERTVACTSTAPGTNKRTI